MDTYTGQTALSESTAAIVASVSDGRNNMGPGRFSSTTNTSSTISKL